MIRTQLPDGRVRFERCKKAVFESKYICLVCIDGAQSANGGVQKCGKCGETRECAHVAPRAYDEYVAGNKPYPTENIAGEIT